MNVILILGESLAQSKGIKKSAGHEVELDWWSKYYASKGEQNKSANYVEHGYDKLQVQFS